MLTPQDFLALQRLCAEADWSLDALPSLFARHAVHEVPVRSQDTIVGLVSTRDLEQAIMGASICGPARRVRDIMTPFVLCVRDESARRDVAEAMLRARIYRVPIVDAAGAFLGVITAVEAARMLVSAQSAAASATLRDA